MFGLCGSSLFVACCLLRVVVRLLLLFVDCCFPCDVGSSLVGRWPLSFVVCWLLMCVVG